MAEQVMHGTYLSMADASDGTFKTLGGMSKVPDIPFEREKVEVTNFSDSNKRYIPGIADLGDPEFEFYNDNTTDLSTATAIKNSYAALRAVETANSNKYFKLVYPDNTGFAFSAYVSTTRNGGGPNDALSFKAKLMISSSITDVTITDSGT